MIKILKYIEFKMNYYCESILSTMKKCLHVLKMKQWFLIQKYAKSESKYQRYGLFIFAETKAIGGEYGSLD